MASTGARRSGEHYKPTEDYGIIGDLETVALVGKDASIDFMCFPRFDSPTIFAALLDHKRGGRFQLCPEINNSAHRQLYLPDSNILLTRFLSEAGVAEISGGKHELVRRAKIVRGKIRFRMVCNPRFDYGRAGHRVHRKKNEVVFASDGPDKTALRLRSNVPLKVENGAAIKTVDAAALIMPLVKFIGPCVIQDGFRH